jgi:hypothetical protein
MKRMKKWLLGISALVMTMLISVTVMADPAIPDLADTMGEGMTAVVGQVMAILQVILPIGLGLVGTFIAVRAGINLVRRLTQG